MIEFAWKLWWYTWKDLGFFTSWWHHYHVPKGWKHQLACKQALQGALAVERKGARAPWRTNSIIKLSCMYSHTCTMIRIFLTFQNINQQHFIYKISSKVIIIPACMANACHSNVCEKGVYTKRPSFLASTTALFSCNCCKLSQHSRCKSPQPTPNCPQGWTKTTFPSHLCPRS